MSRAEECQADSGEDSLGLWYGVSHTRLRDLDLTAEVGGSGLSLWMEGMSSHVLFGCSV